MRLTAALLCCLLATAPVCADQPAAVDPADLVVLDRPTPERVAGGRFQAELDRRMSASWRNVGLRTILARIADERKLAILLDRRIDPTAGRTLDLIDQPLDEGLKQMADLAGAGVSIIGNTVYLGPPDSTAKLRTLILMRSDELTGDDSDVPKGRQYELTQRRTLHWNDLDEPADLVRTIADRYKLRVQGLEQVPYDLWAGATLPTVNACEALSLVLVQFDLTFVWTDAGAGIRIVPAPDKAVIERSYSPSRGQTAAAAAERWRNELAGLDAEVRSGQIAVRGTVEQHEAVKALMRPSSTVRRPSRPDEPTPLSRRQFTLPKQRVSAAAVIEKLEMTGITFRYDREALAAAGIDLTTPLTIEARQATAEEFFQTLCDPLGLTFEIDDLTVTLRPK